MQNLLISESVDLLKILGDTTRLSILQILKNDETSAAELENELDKSQSTISQHIKVLREADLIEADKDGRVNYYKVKNAKVFKILARIKSFIIKTKKEKLDILNKAQINDTLF